ncbi:MAG: hypothetical protein M9958_00320 [Chitinophagales bacterium]|nr:hypothetical protein [Chitinophagales bacterium]
MIRSKSQNARFYSLIQSLNMDADTKNDLVYQYTNGRTTKSSEMTTIEMDYLIGYLNNIIKSQKSRVKTIYSNNSALSSAVRDQRKEDKLRKKIISLFREMNYHTPTGVADMPRIKATLLSNWKKDINEFTEAELSTIIAVLKRDWIPHFYKDKK